MSENKFVDAIWNAMSVEEKTQAIMLEGKLLKNNVMVIFSQATSIIKRIDEMEPDQAKKDSMCVYKQSKHVLWNMKKFDNEGKDCKFCGGRPSGQ